ncbi:MAG TPA: glycosyltransferase family 2 protein [Firmicutes bacterium]|nr:glycosyltransferase family 2 protein [Bacillota bacterium]
MVKKLLSAVVPCYNEESALPLFYTAFCRVTEQLSELSFELIFVDDGSSDQTLQEMRALAEKDSRVRYLSFSRNFGKEAALYAGLQAARGDYVAVMDVDLQDPPELLVDMYRSLTQEGVDCVATRRVTRKGEPPIRSFFARMFYWLINRISKAEIVDGARDFRLMTRQVVDAILSISEYNRFSKGIFGWVGFRTKWLEYENVERAAGTTKWSFWKLLVYSLDGIVAFSTAPLAIASVIGFLFCIVGFITLCIIIMKTLIFGDPVSGWPSLACLIVFIGGLQLFCIGILGQYLSKTYLETKRRPIYILKEQGGQQMEDMQR